MSVGDWVSLYNTGDAACRCLAKVSAVGAGVNGTITVDTTHKFGTVPTVNSGSRNCRRGGAWADLGMVAASACMNTGTATDAFKVYVKAGTYANTTTTRTFALIGTATITAWWAGYKTTPGDMDTSPTSTRTPGTDIPTWTWTTGSVFNINTAHQRFSSIDVNTASITVGSLNLGSSGSDLEFFRCRFTNTGANALSSAVAGSSSGRVRFVNCYFNAPSTVTAVVKFTTANPLYFDGCTFTGGGIGLQLTTGAANLDNCEFQSLGSHAINTTSTGSVNVNHCAGYSVNAGDFWNAGGVPIMSQVANCMVSGYTNFVNLTSTATDTVMLHNNYTHNLTTSKYIGIGDTPSWDDGTESVLPFTSTSNLTTLTTASGYQHGAPGLFENSSTQTFDSAGAADPNTPIRGGGLLIAPAGVRNSNQF